MYTGFKKLWFAITILLNISIEKQFRIPMKIAFIFSVIVDDYTPGVRVSDVSAQTMPYHLTSLAVSSV